MAKISESNARQHWLGAGIAVVIVGAAIWFAPQARVDAPQAAAIAPEVSEAPTMAPPTADIVANAPRFDTFRLEPDGNAVVAGQADAGQTVAIMLAGESLARVQADANGAFVAFVTVAPSDTPRSLSLLGDPDGVAIASARVFLVAPFDLPVIVESDPAPVETIAEATVAAPAPSTDGTVPLSEESEAAPVAVAEAAPAAVNEAAAPTVLVIDETGVRVSQSASDASPEVMANVALDTITYDPAGEVLLSGRAQGEGFVQVYLDNQPITTSRISEAGDWRTDLPEVDTGVYTLRIDEVDNAGAVVSRIETPFKREEPEVVAAAVAQNDADAEYDIRIKTVQPGATLWAIAQERFGTGTMYVAVFEANRDRIRDPNLIYPGQVFVIPD